MGVLVGLVGEFERCKMRQRLNEPPSRLALAVTQTARRDGSARECVKDEEPTVSLQRCVKPAGRVSWRAIALLKPKPSLLPWAWPTTCAMLHTYTHAEV